MSKVVKPTLCLDFDGVIHSYDSGWKGAHIASDDPVPDAMKFIINARPFFDIAVFSSRSGQDGGISAMRQYIHEHLIEHLAGTMKQHAAERAAMNIMEDISFPKEKPPAFLSLDDRAITFNGIFPDIQALRKFNPWNRGASPSRIDLEAIEQFQDGKLTFRGINRAAQAMAESLNGGQWMLDYTDQQRDLWRNRVRAAFGAYPEKGGS
jgi:hypothetical protein